MTKTLPHEALAYNRSMVEKLSRFTAREIKSRLAGSDDINHVATSGEQFALAMSSAYGFQSIGDLIDHFSKCDASLWIYTMQAYGLKTRLGVLLKIISGRSGREWLDYEQETCRHPEYQSR